MIRRKDAALHEKFLNIFTLKQLDFFGCCAVAPFSASNLTEHSTS